MNLFNILVYFVVFLNISFISLCHYPFLNKKIDFVQENDKKIFRHMTGSKLAGSIRNLIIIFDK